MCLYTSVQVTLEASQLLEIDLQEVVSYPMWMLGVELGSPGRIVNFLNCQSFLQPKMDIYYLLQLSSKSSSRNPKHKVCRIFKPEIFHLPRKRSVVSTGCPSTGWSVAETGGKEAGGGPESENSEN